MNNDKKIEKPTWESAEMYLATEIISQSKSHAKRWFLIAMFLLASLVATNTYWIYQINSYDYISQDGTGINNINAGTQGDLLNEPESEN